MDSVGPPQAIRVGRPSKTPLAANAFEDGNNAGGALPANGDLAAPGQRGAGWAFVDTGLLNRVHQAGGSSIWNGVEPNDVGAIGEDAAELRTNGLLNDQPITNSGSRAHVIEWDLNLSAAPAQLDLGWSVRRVTADPAGTAADVANINIGEELLDGLHASTLDLSEERDYLNLGAGGSFPGGGGDDFAVSAEGYVLLADGSTSGLFNVHLNSDDGVRLRLNGDIVGEFVDPTGNCNVAINSLLLSNGDHLEVTYFERGGADKLFFRLASGTDTEGPYIGSVDSGILITTTSIIPEPTTMALFFAGVIGLLFRSRKRLRRA